MRIDEEFKKLIPPLSDDEFKQLEENILSEGIRENIIVWNDVIIDGHNRYEIATKHNMDYGVSEKFFDNRDSVLLWIIDNQSGRRNLSDYSKYELSKIKAEIIRKRAKQNLKTPTGGHNKTTLSNVDKVDTRAEIAENLNWSTGKVAMADIVDKKATEEIKEKLRTNEISINQVYQDIKKEEKKEILQNKKEEYIDKLETAKTNNTEFKIDIYNTENKFRVFYVDPPWNYGDKQNTPNLGGAEKHYSSMTIKELCEMPISKISEKDSVLFLWVTSPLLEECFEIINSWGFKYKTSFVWDKIKHNMGHYNSVRHEFLLIATKGSCTPDNKTLYDSVQAVERNDNHSEKPIEFLNIIDDIYEHGDRIELFCRQPKKENWFYWGNEV